MSVVSSTSPSSNTVPEGQSKLAMRPAGDISSELSLFDLNSASLDVETAHQEAVEQDDLLGTGSDTEFDPGTPLTKCHCHGAEFLFQSFKSSGLPGDIKFQMCTPKCSKGHTSHNDFWQSEQSLLVTSERQWQRIKQAKTDLEKTKIMLETFTSRDKPVRVVHSKTELYWSNILQRVGETDALTLKQTEQPNEELPVPMGSWEWYYNLMLP